MNRITPYRRQNCTAPNPPPRGDRVSRRRTESEALVKDIAKLPHDIQIHIIVETLCEERCFYSLIEPKWHLCPQNRKPQRHGAPEIANTFAMTRVEVYTKGDNGERGTNTVVLDHEHMFVKVLPHDINERYHVIALRLAYPVAFFYALRQAMRLSTHIFTSTLDNYRITTERIAENKDQAPLFVDEAAVKHLPFQTPTFGKHNEHARTARLRLMDGSEGDAINSQYRHIFLGRCELPKPYPWYPTWNRRFHPRYGFLDPCQRELEELQALLKLDWAILGRRLETLMLDLSWQVVYPTDMVSEAAKQMSAHLQLKRLVIMGLRSGGRDGGATRKPTDVKLWWIENLEDDETLNGRENWVSALRGALRPGGELILVDRWA